MREGPERVPTQQVLPSAIIIGKIVLVLVVGTLLARNPTVLGVISEVIIWTAALGCCVLYALFLANKLRRFSATFAAILGADLVLTAVFGIALITQQTFQFEATQFILIAFRLWHMVSMGFIMHRALDIRLGFGIGAGLIIAIFCSIFTEVATQ